MQPIHATHAMHRPPRCRALRWTVARLRGGACLLALLGWCTSATPTRAQWPDANKGTFSAYWAVSGTVHVLEDRDGVLAAAGGLTGTVTVQTDAGPVPSFDTDCVVFSEEGEEGKGRCLWTATDGDHVHVKIRGSGPAGFGMVRGQFIGGTGRFEGISGAFSFEWNYSLSRGQDADLDGHTLQMTGRYALP